MNGHIWVGGYGVFIREFGVMTSSPSANSADRLRNGMGSWAFVFAALLFLAVWMAFNRDVGFDPYPFILLNLLLSCVAALQGAVLLIAARRADQISAELALHDYNTNSEALEIIRRLEDVARDIQRRVGSGEPPETP